MPEFPVESPRMRMDATSVLNPVHAVGQDGSGKRFKTETQDVTRRRGCRCGVWRCSSVG